MPINLRNPHEIKLRLMLMYTVATFYQPSKLELSDSKLGSVTPILAFASVAIFCNRVTQLATPLFSFIQLTFSTNLSYMSFAVFILNEVWDPVLASTSA